MCNGTSLLLNIYVILSMYIHPYCSGPVSRIWSRPDQSSSSIITIGGPVLTRPEVFSLDQDTGSLVVSSATPELAG